MFNLNEARGNSTSLLNEERMMVARATAKGIRVKTNIRAGHDDAIEVPEPPPPPGAGGEL